MFKLMKVTVINMSALSAPALLHKLIVHHMACSSNSWKDLYEENSGVENATFHSIARIALRFVDIFG
jgi:hypothetical protein